MQALFIVYQYFLIEKQPFVFHPRDSRSRVGPAYFFFLCNKPTLRRVFVSKGLFNLKKGGIVIETELFQQLCESHANTIYRIALNYTKNPQDAEALPEGQGSAAGVYELADGSIFLRRAGQERDEELTGRFAGEVWDFSTVPGQSAFLYAPGTDFEVECLMQLGRLTA